VSTVKVLESHRTSLSGIIPIYLIGSFFDKNILSLTLRLRIDAITSINKIPIADNPNF